MTDPKIREWLKMSKELTEDTTETTDKRGYRQGVQDALRTIELKAIEMNPRIEVWDLGGCKAGRVVGCRENQRPQ
jgi:hypothetical protein